MDVNQEINRTGVTVVLRGAAVHTIIPIGRALRAGGITMLEITMETPGAIAVIEKAAAELDDMVITAGTVLDEVTARAAIMAGAQVIFSPTTDEGTIKMAKRYGVISIPGALTPTEILHAYEHGADYVKVFPIRSFGPDYVKDIHGPLPQIPLITTGGVDLENAADYINSGAVAVGIGSCLVDARKPLSEAYLAKVTENASHLIRAIKVAKAEKE